MCAVWQCNRTSQLGRSCLAATAGDQILKKGNAGVQTEDLLNSPLLELTNT